MRQNSNHSCRAVRRVLVCGAIGLPISLNSIRCNTTVTGVSWLQRGPGYVTAATVAAAAGYYDQPLEAKSCFLDHKTNGRLHDASAAAKIKIMILLEIDMMLHDARFLRLFSVR